MAEHLTWESVKPIAESVFCVHTDNATEIDFARHAWTRMRKAGLLDYQDEVGRCAAAIRFMALCDLYLDFVYVVWEDGGLVYYADALAGLSVRPSAVAELVARDPAWVQGPLDASDSDAVQDALATLVRGARGPLLDALTGGQFPGGDLLVLLWRSHPAHHYEDPIVAMEDEFADSIDEVAVNWVIGSGCGFTFRDYE